MQTLDGLTTDSEMLRLLLEDSPDLIYFKDLDSRFLRGSRALCEHLGIAPGQLAGKSDYDFFAPERVKLHFEEEQEIIRTGQPLIGRVEENIGKDGKAWWVLTSKAAFRDAHGNIIGTFGVSKNITALKQAEKELGELYQELERSNRELQDFAFIASHDLQEPLRKIVVFGERLKERNADALDQESLDYLDRMRKAAGRMQSLITDLLTFSRVTTKAQPFTAVNLAEVAAGVVEDLEGRIELVKGRVEVGPLPTIDAEPVQMRQLLQNLIGNALKFRRPEEPPVVKIEAQILPDPMTPGNAVCRLTVSDNCIGFDEKYLDRIFGLFQRLHTKTEYEGTGMGLAIVRKIAMYHGGDITARSKLGEGSTFILTVPARHREQARTSNT